MTTWFERYSAENTYDALSTIAYISRYFGSLHSYGAASVQRLPLKTLLAINV